MAIEWYLQDLREQYGPLGTAELRKKLASFTNLENVLVWREGFQDWKPVAGVFELFDAPGELNQRRRVKGRWALYGLTLGILFHASDVAFEWRGEPFHPWSGHEFENIDRAAASLVIPALLFFLAGTIKDIQAAVAADAQHIAPGTPRFTNFIAKNWRGEYPLPVSYWVFGLIGNFAVALIPLGLAAVYDTRMGFQPVYVFAFILSVWLLSIGISVWQWVGVWRSANRYIERKSSKLERAPWAGVAKLMTVIAILQLAAAIVTSAIPQVTEASRMAFLDDPDIPDYSIRVMRNGTEAELTGGIKYGLTDDLKKIFQASRQIRVVHLNSVGGRIGEGEKLYNFIRDRRLTTYVSANCMSACTLAFSGGAERVLLHGAVLGFHRGSFAGEDQKDSPELEGQRKIFTEAGYDAPFIARALATPSSNIWKPSEAELLKSGVVTKVSDGTDYAFSGFPADASSDSFSKSLKGDAGIYAAISGRFPKEYDEMVNSYYDAFVAGKTEVEAITILHAKLESVISANRSLADDDVLIDFGNLMADELAALQSRPATCYQYATGGVLDTSLMPQALSKREIEVAKRVIRTAASRPDADAPAQKLWPKLSGRLAAKGVTEKDLDLIRGSKVADSQQARYCSVLTALYREAAALPQHDGAIILRSMLAAK
jgi:GYF domain 2